MSFALAITSTLRRGFALMSSFRKDGWALADQLLISGANFATMILIARGLSPEAFGWFALAFSVVLFANNIQYGLVTQPHNVLGTTRRGEEYVRYTSSTALSQILIGAAGAVLALLSWLVACAVGWSAASIILPLAPLIFVFQLQEFVRRALYTQQRIAAATFNDVMTYGSRVVVLVVLWWYGTLSVSSALYAIAGTAAIGTVIGFVQIRKTLAGRFDASAFRENWDFGKWLVGTELVGYWLSTQLFVYLAAAFVGVWAAGVLKALDVAFGPARVLTLALCNVLPIRFARTLEERGNSALDAQLRNTLLVSVPILGGYCLLIAIFAKPALELLFDDKYLDQAPVLALYAAYAFVSFLSMILATALRAKRLTQQVFLNRVLASAVAIPFGCVMIFFFGVFGAVLGMVSTYFSLSIFYSLALRREPVADESEHAAHRQATTDGCSKSAGQLHKPKNDKAAVAQVELVLRTFTGSTENDPWLVHPLGCGGQGQTLLVRRRDGRNVWGEHDALVVKLFDADVPEVADAIDCEYTLLADFSGRGDGKVIRGWRIRVPHPLFKCSEPFALVMTVVPGEPLYTLLQSTDDANAEVIESSADAMIGALRPLWFESGRLYGDLHFENIMCDVHSRSVSFVDGGTPQRSWMCDSVAAALYPASRDLAYLLFDVVTSCVRVSLHNPRGAARQTRLVERILAAFLKEVKSSHDRRALLEEIRGCITLHMERVGTSWKPCGVWRRVVHFIASRKIAVILRKLELESDRTVVPDATPAFSIETPRAAQWQGGES